MSYNELPDNFHRRVLIRHTDPAGCWEWTGAKNAGGYGQCWTNGKYPYAHRISYTAQFGPIPDGLVIDHLCRNRACVNPFHMEAVTRAENVRRGIGVSVVNAARYECPQGHKDFGVRGNGRRYCLECNRVRTRENYKKKGIDNDL